MNQRERLLMIGVVALIGLVIAGSMFRWLSNSTTAKNNQIRGLEKVVADKNFEIQLGGRASERLAEYETRALPGDPEQARALYQTWLLQTVDDAGLEGLNVTAVVGRPKDDVFFVHPFNITGRCNLEELTEFLYAFYSADLLHRIDRMNIKPIKDSKDLNLTMVLEAVSMENSPNTEKLPEGVSDRITDKLADYVKPITERNLFGPPNNPPRLAGLDRREVVVNEMATISAQARDPDGDSLMYEMEPVDGLQAQIDRRGQIRFRPTELGEYTMTITVRDQGVPSKFDRQTYKVSVVEPRVVVTEPRVEPPKFDESKFAFLTGVVEINGVPEIWLHLRTSGRLLKLRTGQRLEVGTIKGEVTRIHSRSVEIKTDGDKHLLVRHGQTLSEGTELPLDEI